MRRGVIAAMAVAIAACSLISGNAPACECPEPLSVAEEFARSTAVFSGRVVSIGFVGMPDNITHLRVRFERYDCWKGAPEPQVAVITGLIVELCGYPFELDAEYLVYATWQSSPGWLLTHQCTRTRLLSEAGDDIAALGTPTCTVAITPSTWGTVKRLYGTRAQS